jgi:hypothetical protein
MVQASKAPRRACVWSSVAASAFAVPAPARHAGPKEGRGRGDAPRGWGDRRLAATGRDRRNASSVDAARQPPRPLSASVATGVLWAPWAIYTGGGTVGPFLPDPLCRTRPLDRIAPAPFEHRHCPPCGGDGHSIGEAGCWLNLTGSVLQFLGPSPWIGVRRFLAIRRFAHTPVPHEHTGSRPSAPACALRASADGLLQPERQPRRRLIAVRNYPHS